MNNNLKSLNIVNESIRGSLGEAYAEIDGNRYYLASVKKFEAKSKLNVERYNTLGTTHAQAKGGQLEGEFECTLYYNFSTLRKLHIKFQDEGIMPVVNIQIVNNDPNTIATLGRKSYTFTNCIFEELVMAILDVENNAMEEEVSGTYDKVIVNADTKDAPLA